MSIQFLNETSTITNFVNNYDVFLLDCDGVLWNETVIEGAFDTLSLLTSLKKKIFFVTNNSTKTRKQYQERFTQLGIKVELDQIISSAWLAAQYLRTNFPEVKRVYVVGEYGIEKELEDVGIQVVGGERDANKSMSMDLFVNLDEKQFEDIGAVVCGWDRNFSFYKLSYASLCLQLSKNKCKFIATNKDAGDKLGNRIIPGGGCMVSAIEYGTQTQATVVGKPSSWLVDQLVQKHNLKREKMVMIGDRLDTDILLGINSNIASCLVLTGVTTKEEAFSETNSITPNYVMNSIGDIIKLYK